MKSNIETMIQRKILEQILGYTPTIHDRRFVKHVTNKHSTGLNNRSEHRGIILIRESLRSIDALSHYMNCHILGHILILHSFTNQNTMRAIHQVFHKSYS